MHRVERVEGGHMEQLEFDRVAGSGGTIASLRFVILTSERETHSLCHLDVYHRQSWMRDINNECHRQSI